jgi:hypothetical protein
MKYVETLTYMDQTDWEELLALKAAISYNPATVHPEKQERFTELLVKSLCGKGENVNLTEPTNY